MGLKEIRELKSGKKKEKKVYYIPHFSKTRAKDQVKYRKIVKTAAEESLECEIKSPDCIGIMGGMQHMERRGKNLLVREKMIRSCNPCNLYCETHSKWAKENGFSKSRLHKTINLKQWQQKHSVNTQDSITTAKEPKS